MSESKGSLKIYFCGSICGGRNDQALYASIIEHLKTYGTVLTEAIGRPDLTDQDGVAYGKEKWLHDRNMEYFHKADVLIAEVTQPSLGVGYEMGRAVEFKKKTLCLFRPESGRRLSCMIRGAADGETMVVKDYTESEVTQVIDDYLKHSVLDFDNSKDGATT